MYLACYQGVDGRSLYQALIHFPGQVLHGRESAWTVAYRAFIDDLIDSEVDVAYRISHSSGRILRYVLVSSHDRALLGDLSDRACQLNTIAEASVVRPRNSTEHDRYASQFPPARQGVVRQPYYAGRFVIPCDFFAYPLCSQLLQIGLSSRTDFALQINCRRYSISNEELRIARKGFVDLRLSGQSPSHVIDHVSRQLDELPNRTYLVEECIAAASVSMLRTVDRYIDAEFRRRHALLGFSDSPLGEPPSDDESEMGLHSSYFEGGPLPQHLWRSVESAPLADFLGWAPDEIFVHGVTGASPQASVNLLEHIARRLEEILRTAGGHPSADVIVSLARVLRIGDIDLLAAAATARGIIEEIARSVLLEISPADARKTVILDNMIKRLEELRVVPPTVLSSMHTVRMVGNIGAHRKMTLTREDLTACMMAALRVTEWFLMERNPARASSSIST